jgi:hypothetical protein
MDILKLGSATYECPMLVFNSIDYTYCFVIYLAAYLENQNTFPWQQYQDHLQATARITSPNYGGILGSDASMRFVPQLYNEGASRVRRGEVMVLTAPRAIGQTASVFLMLQYLFIFVSLIASNCILIYYFVQYCTVLLPTCNTLWNWNILIYKQNFFKA